VQNHTAREIRRHLPGSLRSCLARKWKKTMNPEQNPSRPRNLVANWDTLRRIFIMPENDSSRTTLIKYMQQILFDLHDFLQTHVGITENVRIRELATRFKDTHIPSDPERTLAEVITDLTQNVAPHAVNVASPYFVGHMTSAIPLFMVHLQTIMAALNQNVVKLETSKVTSIMEKQVLARIHRLIYAKDDDFYGRHVQSTDTTLGGFVEDGTLANVTALWVARNLLLAPCEGFSGVEREGIAAAYRAYGMDRCVVLVSQLGHYSLRKAGGLLGIGNTNVVPVGVDSANRIDLGELLKTIRRLKAASERTRILAIVGIAGTTETGAIDPLPQLAEICSENGVHFHVDAAWGGPTLVSEKHKGLLKGIERADSVTIDGHKQFYMPMTCGMVCFKDPMAMDAIAYYAHYVNRRGSFDLGIRSLAGSRASTSLILECALKIMGTRGYALLIDHGIQTAQEFALEIERRSLFELISPPQLNILTYRYCPGPLRQRLAEADGDEKLWINERLNRANIILQRLQREAGKSFVSRTTLRRPRQEGGNIVVLRAVVMNPMTNMRILLQILDEQEEICMAKQTEWGIDRTVKRLAVSRMSEGQGLSA